ncbi:conserved hypothetical protein [Luteimonas sp. 9C]|uniref:hypothetical protein n=1 Tax=Luteimonas sp. 9C TaxID=2653148 RepID=UPI0012F44818|nr:hypothetical protein [Luteimonas sp. 9C]VXB36361.1 conserved hypothetical protein [Luteimonas sp. 9C]
MPGAFRFKSSKDTLSAGDIGALRRICPLSFGEIQRRAADGLVMLDVPVFSGEWPASKTTVVGLLAGIEDGSLPLRVLWVEACEIPDADETPVTVSEAREHLQRFRDIALEQDRQQQLALGQIASPNDYVPLLEHEA